MLDHDSIDAPGIDFAREPARAAEYLRSTLPEEFRTAACVWQASGSAGFKAGVRLHTWWLLSRPVEGAELKVWLPKSAGFDEAVYRDSQPLYTANPVLDGVPDPMTERLGLLAGAQVVQVPGALQAPARKAGSRGSARAVVPADARYVEVLIDGVQGEWWQFGLKPGAVLPNGRARRDVYNGLVLAVGTRAHWLGDIGVARGKVHAIFKAWAAQAEPGNISERELLRRVDLAFDDGVEQSVEPEITEADEKKANRAIKQVVELMKHDPAQLPRAAEKLAPHVQAGVISCDYAIAKVAKAVANADVINPQLSRDVISNAVTAAAASHVAIPVEREAWALGMRSGKEGGLTPGAYNLRHLLRHHPDIALWHDTRADVRHFERCPWRKVHWFDGTSAVRDSDAVAFRAWVEHEVGWVKLPAGEPLPYLYEAADEKPRDPFLESLRALQWDGAVRLRAPGFISALLGCQDTEVNREIFARWMLSAVARTFAPGCKADHVLVLEGEQGAKKSSFLQALVGDIRFYGTLPPSSLDLSNPRTLNRIYGPVVVEVGENAALSKREIAEVKDFLSLPVDPNWQPLHAKTKRTGKRSCVFAITTNEDTYLRDATGNRRYWPLRCGEIHLDFLRAHLAQIWAEAVAMYNAGQRWWFEKEETARFGLTELQASREEDDDPWVALLAPLLDRDYRKQAPSSAEPATPPVGTLAIVRWLPTQLDDQSGHCRFIQATQALELLGRRAVEAQPKDVRRVGEALRRLGWRRGTVRTGGQTPKAFVRP